MNNINQQLPVSPEVLPNQEFIEMINRIEGPKKAVESPTSPSDEVVMVETLTGPVPLSKKAIEPQKQSQPQEEAKRDAPRKIELEYRYSGECPVHRIDVATLTADVDEKCITFAYCEQCKKNIYSQTVPIIGDGVPPQRRFKKAGKELI